MAQGSVGNLVDLVDSSLVMEMPSVHLGKAFDYVILSGNCQGKVLKFNQDSSKAVWEQSAFHKMHIEESLELHLLRARLSMIFGELLVCNEPPQTSSSVNLLAL